MNAVQSTFTPETITSIVTSLQTSWTLLVNAGSNTKVKPLIPGAKFNKHLTILNISIKHS